MEILDLLAKISWQTNTEELKKVNKELEKQDDALVELIKRGQRLEEQRNKANSASKQRELNKELEKNKKAIESITDAQRKQNTGVLDLVKRQKQLADAIDKATDPAQARELLGEFKKLEEQIKRTSQTSSGMSMRMGGIGQALLGGLGIGAGTLGLEAMVSGIKSVYDAANTEFMDAEATTMKLQNTLRTLGKEKYFDSLIAEANDLAKEIGYLDNDDIVSAQQKLLVYGKVGRDEISRLLPIIADLAVKLETDVPSATETMINILEGRGGSALRQVGLSIKDAETTTERLGVVFEELGPKIAGSTEVVKNSTEGMTRALDQQVKDLEEQIGKSSIKLKRFFTEVYAGFIGAVGAAIQTNEEKSQNWYDNTYKQYLSQKQKLSDAELAAEQKKSAERMQLVRNEQNKIAALQAEGNFDWGGKAWRERQNRIEGSRKQILNILADINATTTEYQNRQNAASEDAAVRLKRDQEDAAQAEKETAAERKKAANEQAAAAKALAAQKKKISEDLAKQVEEDRIKSEEWFLSADERERMALIRKYDEQVALAKGNAALLTQIRENYLNGLLHIERKYDKEFDKLELDNLDQKKKVEKEKVDLSKDTAYQALKASVEKSQQDAANSEKKKQEDAEEFELIMQNSIAVANAASEYIRLEEAKTEALINQQSKRVEEARNNSAASLKIEEDRMNELLEQKRQFQAQQRIIDAAIIVANQAVAISGAIRQISEAGGNPALIVANAIAIAASVAASIVAIKSAFADIPAFRDGGYTGDGDPGSESNAIGPRPYIYHKKEFVMNERLTAKHRDLFEGMHKGELMVNKLDDGKFYITKNGLNPEKLVDEHISIKNSMDTSSLLFQMEQLNDNIQRLKLSVTNNFDAKGFGIEIAGQLAQIEMSNKLRG